MAGVILYQSKYGATEKYVRWLEEATGFDVIRTKDAKLNQVLKYDIIILAGGIYASGIAGLPFLKKHIRSLADKRIAIFCVGASPFEKDAFENLCEHNLKDGLEAVPCFYGRGMWDESAMTFADRALCHMLQKAVAKQAPETYEPWQKALICAAGQKCDWTDREYLNGLLEWLRSESKN